MKAILYSIMVVALVGGMVGGGLFAYFSDTATSEGNTFQAGTVVLDATFGPIEYANGVDAKPCEVAYEYETVTNAGRNNLNLFKWVKIGTETAPNGPAGTLLSTVTYHDISIDMNNDGDYDDEGECIIADGAELLSASAGAWIALGEMPAGTTWTVRESFHIMAEAGNEYQDASIEIFKAFYGIQTSGPVPTADPFVQ